MAAFVQLKNYARGGGKYHAHSLDIFRELLDAPEAILEPLSSFLGQRLFELDAAKWYVFNFGARDWDLCARLLQTRGAALEANCLTLIQHYVAANIETVEAVQRLNRTVSARLLAGEKSDLPPATLTRLEVQSLFGIRLECAQRQASSDIRERLSEIFPPQSWGKVRLLYPLVYHAVSQTPAIGLDGFLSYVVTGREHSAERTVIRLLLSDEAARKESFAFKAFVGLMGHPYDACDIVLDHIEYELVSDRPLARHFRSFLHNMAGLLPGGRADRLNSLLAARTLDFHRSAGADGLGRWFDLEPQDAVRYARLVALEPRSPSSEAGAGERPMAILGRMKASDYPDPADFNRIVAERFAWSFTDGGRLIAGLLRAFFMIDRTERDIEARDALGLVSFYGMITPVIASAPSAMRMLRNVARGGVVGTIALESIERETGEAFDTSRPFANRLWINDLQWTLSRLEAEGRIREWLRHVRREAKLRPAYLTGINWNWIDEVIELERMDPFVGFDGAYLFLLMEFETASDPLRLRFSLEPLLRDRLLSEIIDALLDEFGEAAAAVIRRFFTVQNLMAMGYAPNFIAALDQRVQALERYIRRFSFGPLLTEEMYDSEARALTSELLLTNVNVGKFEVPWDTFRKDALEKQQDLYLAFCSLKPQVGEEFQLTGLRESPHSFSSGRTQIYKHRIYQTPLISLVIALIADFLEHPAFGLEVILSGRFRHSNLLQELWGAMPSAGSATIPGVTVPVQRELTAIYRDIMEAGLERWCTNRLHTARKDKPRALFDIIPDQQALEGLLARAESAADLPGIIDVVIEWLKGKLRGQVAAAQAAFTAEVTADFAAAFTQAREDQLGAGSYRPQDIQKVYSAVTDAITRRMDELRSWFDGVDATASEPVSLSDLSAATETVFRNVMPGKTLAPLLRDDAGSDMFEPAEVKIAFDMIREIFFNAIKRGRGPRVELRIRRYLRDGLVYYSFSNRLDAAGATEPEQVEEIVGSRYEGHNEALKREGNSGRLKIAASAATLIGSDIVIRSIRRRGFHHLVVPVRREPCPG